MDTSLSEDKLLANLDHANYVRRSEAVESLRAFARRSLEAEADGDDGYQLGTVVSDRRRLFTLLKQRLDDVSWNVAHQTTQLVGDLVGVLGPDTSLFLSVVLPTLVSNLGDNKILIRKESVSALSSLCVQGENRKVVSALVRHGYFFFFFFFFFFCRAV